MPIVAIFATRSCTPKSATSNHKMDKDKTRLTTLTKKNLTY